MSTVPRGRSDLIGGLRTYSATLGTGRPIVLVHGGGIDHRYPESSASWHACAPELARSFETHLYDKPGCGATADPASDADYSVDAVLRHLEAYLEERTSSPAVLVGHSRGTLPVFAVALQRPDLVSHLVILNTSSFAPASAGLPQDFYSRHFDGQTGLPSRHALAELFSTLFRNESPQRSAYFESIAAAAKSPPPSRPMTEDELARRAILARDYYRPSIVSMRNDIESGLRNGNLCPPLLIYWGASDLSAPLGVGVDLFLAAQGNSSRATFIAVDDAGHYPHIEQPGEFASAVSSWVASRTSSQN